jgi:hypothetical protein
VVDPPSFSRPLPFDAELAAEPFTSDVADIGNGYQSLAKLFDLPRGGAVRILEGELQFLDAAAKYRVQKPGTGAPPAASAGVKVGIDSSRTFGPNSPWRLDAIWVKELVDNGGAKVLFTGWVV